MSLIADIQKDMEKGAVRLITEYRSRLVSDARRLCENPSDVEDLVSRTLVKVINKIETHNEDCDFYIWMKTIMVNIHRNDLAHPVARGTETVDDETLEQITGADWSTDEQLLKNSDSEALREALHGLDPKYNQVLLMRYYQEFSMKQIANILQLPLGTVTRRVQIAHQILAGKLRAEFGKMKKPLAVLLAALLGIGSLFGAWKVAETIWPEAFSSAPEAELVTVEDPLSQEEAVAAEVLPMVGPEDDEPTAAESAGEMAQAESPPATDLKENQITQEQVNTKKTEGEETMGAKKLMAAVGAAVAAVGLYANTYYVTPEGTGDGSSWDNAFGSIQMAIDAAGTEPSIIFLAGGNYELSEQVAIPAGVDIVLEGGFTDGVKGVTPTVVKPEAEDSALKRIRLFSIGAANVGFKDMTLTGGCPPAGATQEGLAVRSDGANLRFENCVLTDNGGNFDLVGAAKYSRYGGAVYQNGGTLTATGTTFARNYVRSPDPGSGTSAYGGAIYATGAAVALTNNFFDGNYLLIKHFWANGGAIDLEGGSASIVGCAFTSNYVQRCEKYNADRVCGGTLYANNTAPLMIEDCSFVGSWINAYHDDSNFGHGGFIYLEGAKLDATIRNSTAKNLGFRAGCQEYDSGAITVAGGRVVFENDVFAHVHGNVIEMRGGAAVVRNCTVVDAVRALGGNGYGLYQAAGTITCVNSLFWDLAGGTVRTTGGTCDISHCNAQESVAGEANISQTPYFKDSAAGDYRLLWYSPCIEAGADVEGLEDDRDGAVRPQDGDCDGIAKYDIGAYEASAASVDLNGVVEFSATSAKEPYDATANVHVFGATRTGLTFSWKLTRVVGSSLTVTEKETVVPTCVFSGLEMGEYTIACTVSGGGESVICAVINSLTVTGDSFYATPTGAGAKDGSSWSDAFAGIAAAVAAVGTEPAKIRLLAGDYEFSEQVTIGIGADITLIGGHTGIGSERSTEASVIKPAEGVRTRFFSVEGLAGEPSRLALDGVALTGGSMPTGASQFGLAICAKNAAVSLKDCVLEGNGGEYLDINNNSYSRYGGAVYQEGGSFTAMGTTFRGNYIRGNGPGSGTSAYGGALYLKTATVALTNDVFEGNYLQVHHFWANGGAIDLEACSSASIVDCVFLSNHVQRAESYTADRVYGGTLYADSCALLLVEGCTFTDSWINSYHETAGVDMTFGHGGTMYLTGASQNAMIRRTVVNDCGYREVAKGYDSGALTLAGGTLTMENVLVGHVQGNCFEVCGGTANVRRCTFADAAEAMGLQGYGLYHAIAGSVASFTESILYGNAKGGYAVNGLAPAAFTYCCLQDGGEGLGNFSNDPLFADTIYFHLKSQAGRYDGGWFAGGTWVTDAVTSPALDRGDPASEVGDEPQPNRHFPNIGYDAGLSVATKSYLGEPAVPTSLAVYLYPLADFTETTARAFGEVACVDGGAATVTVCWGATDGGDDLAAWEQKAVFNDVADWMLVERTIESAGGMTYVRLHAADRTSTTWSAAKSFVPVLPPELSDVSISHVTRTSFRAHGKLVGDGGIDTQVRVRYWTDDESQSVTVLYNEGKAVVVGTAFTIQVSGLEPGQTYHYAIEAFNSSGVAGEPMELMTVSTEPIVIYVTPEGAGVRDGSSWGNALGNLQDAIDICFCAGDLICLKSGEYLAAQTKEPSDHSHYIVSAAAGLTIRGGYAGEGTPGAFAEEPTMLRRDKNATPNPNRRIIHALNSTLTLDGLTVADGLYSDSKSQAGHGLLLETCTTTIRNCVFEKNGRTTDGGKFSGGAIYAAGGSLVIADCLFDGNWINNWGGNNCSACGGAIYATGVSLSVTGSSFIRNWVANKYQQTYGGAIYANGGTFTLENSTFYTNCVIKNSHESSLNYGCGGTLYLADITAPVVSNCIFQGGYLAASTHYGNIYLSGANQQATFTHCKILDTGKDDRRPQDGAPISAGGFYLESGSLALANCLIARVGVSNAVDVAGGTFSAVNCTVVDVAEVGVNQVAGTASLKNSIVWNCGGGATAGTVVLDTCETERDPLLCGPTKKRAYHLRHGSPCVGVGDAAIWAAADTDLDGLPRIRNGKVDLGCYSFNAPGFMMMLK